MVELIKENKWKVKIFVNGRYYSLPKKKRVQLPFTRSIAEYYLDLEQVDEEEPVDKTHIQYIGDYHQITRVKKRRKRKK